MSKNKSFNRTVELPLEKIYEVVSSEEYLLNIEQRDDTEVTVVLSELDRDDDDAIVADVAIEFLATPSAEAEDAAEQAGQGVGDAAEGAEPRTMRISQRTTVEQPANNGFIVHTAMPLPGDMGDMNMRFTYASHPVNAELATVKIDVLVDVPVPGVGAMIENKMLEDSESTVDRGIERIIRLAGGAAA